MSRLASAQPASMSICNFLTGNALTLTALVLPLMDALSVKITINTIQQPGFASITILTAKHLQELSAVSVYQTLTSTQLESALSKQ